MRPFLEHGNTIGTRSMRANNGIANTFLVVALFSSVCTAKSPDCLDKRTINNVLLQLSRDVHVSPPLNGTAVEDAARAITGSGTLDGVVVDKYEGAPVDRYSCQATLTLAFAPGTWLAISQVPEHEDEIARILNGREGLSLIGADDTFKGSVRYSSQYSADGTQHIVQVTDYRPTTDAYFAVTNAVERWKEKAVDVTDFVIPAAQKGTNAKAKGRTLRGWVFFQSSAADPDAFWLIASAESSPSIVLGTKDDLVTSKAGRAALAALEALDGSGIAVEVSGVVVPDGSVYLDPTASVTVRPIRSKH